MAITIVDEPLAITPVGQRLMIVATSDNVAEPGFRYKVSQIIGAATIDFYIPPNPSDALIFDVAPLLTTSNMEVLLTGDSVHETVTAEQETTGYVRVDMSLEEAWEVSGVLTDDPDALGPTLLGYDVWNGTFQASDGYKPSVSRFTLDGPTKCGLSDRQWDTHTWNYAETFGFSAATNKVFIPCTEADWGVMNIIPTLGSATKLRFTIYASNGTPTSADLTIIEVAPYPVYPANVNVNTDSLPKPMDFPGWRCYTVQALDGSNNPVSVLYVFYNATLWGNTDCRYDRIRLAWVGFGGSWEYQNFIKLNEITNAVERKTYRKVWGNYGSTFTATGMDAGLTSVKTVVDQTLLATSDWLEENEFLFLRGLFVSNQVHWVQDDGTFYPVIVEDNSYTEKKARNGKLVNQSIRVKLANQLWT